MTPYMIKNIYEKLDERTPNKTSPQKILLSVTMEIGYGLDLVGRWSSNT